MYIALSLSFSIADLPGGAIVNIVKAIIGILMSIQLCSLLLDNAWIQQYILPMSNFTYAIYLLSWFGQYAVKIITVNILNLHWSIVVLSMFIAGLLIPILICKIVDRYSILRNQKLLRLIIGY